MRQLQAGIIRTGLVGSFIQAFAVGALATFCAVPPTIPGTVPGPTILSPSTVAPGTPTPAPTATAAHALPTTAPTATALPAAPSKVTSTVIAAATQPSAPATTLPVAPPRATAASSNGPTAKVDMDKIFPPGAGRDLVLYNCTGCHSFVRLVIGQRTREAWQAVRRRMGPKARGLSDQQLDDLFSYLEANFNDTKPVPSVPDWLLGSY